MESMSDKFRTFWRTIWVVILFCRSKIDGVMAYLLFEFWRNKFGGKTFAYFFRGYRFSPNFDTSPFHRPSMWDLQTHLKGRIWSKSCFAIEVFDLASFLSDLWPKNFWGTEIVKIWEVDNLGVIEENFQFSPVTSIFKLESPLKCCWNQNEQLYPNIKEWITLAEAKRTKSRVICRHT